VGLGGKSFSVEDESLVALLTAPNTQSSSAPEQLYFIDARSYLAASLNYVNGGGYEPVDRYPGSRIAFQNIDNIHCLRSSYRAFKSLILSSRPDPQAIASTSWMNHIRLVLSSSLKVADLLCTQNKSVVVHCSDGWDRTSQLVSLAELLIDPFYRTMKGFGILIQKDWLAFGHKFGHRVGHGQPEGNNEQSPIFLQFIDAVYQVVAQFPNMFEFNETYLITILDEVNFLF